MPLFGPFLTALLVLPCVSQADAAAPTPREAAAAILFAADDAALEPYLLRSTREQLQLVDPEVRAALLEAVRPLGVLQEREGARVERLSAGDRLARVTIEGEVVQVGLGPLDPERARDWRSGAEEDPADEGLVELEMTVSEPGGATAYLVPMVLGLRQEGGAWRLARANYGVNPFHLDPWALVYWLEDPRLADRVQGAIAARNARAVLGDLRTVIAAEMAYATSNGGFFDTPQCLARPATCLPAVAADAPAFLGAELASLAPKAGYKRSFHPGPQASAERVRAEGGSASSVTAFAYVAVPLKPGFGGAVSFCADSTGRTCVHEGVSEPPVKDGLCEPCKPLE